jgi:hypothetical protein
MDGNIRALADALRSYPGVTLRNVAPQSNGYCLMFELDQARGGWRSLELFADIVPSDQSTLSVCRNATSPGCVTFELTGGRNADSHALASALQVALGAYGRPESRGDQDAAPRFADTSLD